MLCHARTRHCGAALALTIFVTFPTSGSAVYAQAANAPLAPELTGLGTLHVPMTTDVPRAQRRQGQTNEAIRLLTEAVAIEDAIPYNEPPVWHQPPRQVLGAVLLDAGRASEAEAVYRQDLQRFRENGWSLFGLWRSLELQGRADEAAETRRRFEKAWARADVTLTSSRILDPPDIIR